MAKKPSVRYWASRKAYCCEIDGTQHILPKGPSIHLHATRKSGVPGVFDIMARGFGKLFGPKRVCELKPSDFDKELASQTWWNPTSQAHAAALILGALGCPCRETRPFRC